MEMFVNQESSAENSQPTSVSFPEELWEKILYSPSLTFRDLCRCSEVSRKLFSIVRSPRLWKSKFQQSWPSLYKQVICMPESLFTGAQLEKDDWQNLCKFRNSLVDFVRRDLKLYSQKNVRNDRWFMSYSEFSSFTQVDLLTKKFLLDELVGILKLGQQGEKLTECYYGRQVAKCLCHQILRMEVDQWLENAVSVERGAFLLGAWFQTDKVLDYGEVCEFFDQMAERVKDRLKERRPRHPVLTEPFYQRQELENSVWNGKDSRSILEALSYVFAIEYGFRGNSENYYNPENSFLNKVIETRMGIPVTLSVIYQAVAKRLGVRCELVNFPSHMLLKFLEHPELGPEQQYTFIDGFVNPQRLMSQAEVWHAKANLFHGSHAIPRDPLVFNSAFPLQVIRRMWNNLSRVDERWIPVTKETLCSAYELGIILTPSDVHSHLFLARYYFSQEFNIELIVGLMQRMVVPEGNVVVAAQRDHYIEMALTRLEEIAMEREKELIPKRRTLKENRHVKWAVGQIMRHRKYNYTCVITGWDGRCAASVQWKNQMGVKNLERKDNQPFYHVLVCDGSNRYAAEDNLIKEDNPGSLTHPEIGKFFEKFCGTWYKMNPEKVPEYPEDEQATLEYCRKNYGE